MTTTMAALALLVASNPARRRLELDPRPGWPVAGVAAVGVWLVIVALAALSGPVLDWLDVSEPTFRIGAGLVLTLRGLLDLVLRPRPEPPGPGGWLDALWPVGFPVLLRPEVAVLAVAVGADIGVGSTALVAIVALALSVVAIVVPWSRALARGLGAVTSAGAVVVGVALTVGGVLDI